MQRRTFLQTGLLIPAFSLPGNDFQQYHDAPHQQDQPAVVINAGIGGNNTIEMLARVTADCLSHRPDLTILMAGTNDMNSRKHVPLADYEKNMRRLVSDISSTGSKVLLMTILPAYEPYLFTRHLPEFYQPEGFAGRNKGVNDVIRKIAAVTGQPLLDMHHLFERIGNIGEGADSLLKNEINSGEKDGIHPTAEGYRLMGAVIYDCILQKKLPHTKVVCFGDSITHGDGGTAGHSYPACLKKLLRN